MDTTTEQRRPYDAEHVIIQDNGQNVWVLWTADPAETAKTINVMDGKVEVVAHISRLYKRNGHAQAGWFMDDRRGGFDFIATNKPTAMRILRHAIAEYFIRRPSTT